MSATLKQQKYNYKYIDLIKLIACLLVVFYHFSSSLLAANLINESPFYNFFVQTVNTFHVPLFFVCSGFLYQNSNRVHNLKSWKSNIIRKFIDLGVPYFTFSTITFLLKTIFESSVNTPIKGYWNILFLNPTSPYWYLYTLFFIFLITPCFKSKKGALLLLLFSFCLKTFNIFISVNNIEVPYMITSVSGNLIWFSLGVAFFFFSEDIKKIKIKFSAALFVLALIISVIFYHSENSSAILKFIIGLTYVLSIYSGTLYCNNKIPNYISKVKEYTMPVYLMHTIFAAGLRIVLLKLGVDNIIIHILFGIVGSIIVPVIIYEIAKATKLLLIFFNPTKTIKSLRKA